MSLFDLGYRMIFVRLAFAITRSRKAEPSRDRGAMSPNKAGQSCFSGKHNDEFYKGNGVIVRGAYQMYSTHRHPYAGNVPKLFSKQE